MEHIGTWFAIASVSVGFVVLLVLLFKEPDNKKK
jgi:hypothetical protein